MLPWRTPSALSLGLSLALFSAAWSQTDPVQVYSVTPNPAPADREFALTLLGDFDCVTTFSRQNAEVSGNEITLSFVANSSIVINETAQRPCPVFDQAVPPADNLPILPFGPSFKLPALKAGEYKVWVLRMFECQFTKPLCAVKLARQYAGVLKVSAEGAITYSISPTETAADKDFELQLLSFDFNCGTTFDHLASAVANNQITLTFLDHQNPAAVCPAIVKAHGPAYKMAALKAGSYSVYAARLPACAAQGCKMAPIRTFAGTLTVGRDPGKDGWFIDPKRTQPNKPFTMKLLNEAYGNCGTQFPNASLTVEDGKIFTTFSIEINSEIDCIWDMHPFGPSFEVPALKAGIYPVYATIVPTCMFSKPPCMPLIAPRPQVVDTLVVSNDALGLKPFLNSTAGFSASLQGARLEVALPKGSSGSWKIDVLGLDGRGLGSSVVSAEGGAAARVDLRATPQGIFLVKLEGPDHAVRTLMMAPGK